jgi:phosphoenolpyruvate-protein kinase (PTS system EI component)
LPVSPGIARGKAFLYKAEVLHESKDVALTTNPKQSDQHERIKAAIIVVREGLETDARDLSHALDNNSGDIFRTQSAMVQDRTVIGDLEQYLSRESLDAGEAVRAVFTIVSIIFRGSGNGPTRARSDDVEDIYRRLLLSLRGIHAHRL